jgi:hypothetical protein
MRNDAQGPSRRRIVVFRVIAAVTGLIFLVPVLNALAPWTILLDTGDARPELDRWFITVSGAEDMIQAVTLLALAWRPRQPLLAFYLLVAVSVAAVVNLPFVPSFVVILALVVPALATYPYWSELRELRHWWERPQQSLLLIGAVTGIATLLVAVAAISRQIGGTGPAAEANWWADYAEHLLLLSVAVLVASSGRPGWRVLTSAAGGAWAYLGLVAALILPGATGSWGVVGGFLGLVVGITLAGVAVAGEPRLQILRRHEHPH